VSAVEESPARYLASAFAGANPAYVGRRLETLALMGELVRHPDGRYGAL
jgi:hypothetical protein